MQALTVPAKLESLALIRRCVSEAAEAAGLDKKASYRLRLAVDEVATNIITHGYMEAGRTGDVVVKAAIDESALAVTLEDEAIPFDPRSLERPEHIDLPIEERPIGGLGVFLAIDGVDEFTYEHVGNTNRNIFVMKRPEH